MAVPTKKIKAGFFHSFMFGVILAILFPLLWMVLVSIRPADQVFGASLFFSTSFSLESYKQVFEQRPLGVWMMNTAVVSILQTAGQVMIAIFAAFAFSYFRFPGRDVLFYFVLVTMIVPLQALMVPTYLIVDTMGWLNSFAAVIVPTLASGYAIFLMRQFFLQVPKELTEAAKMDGCGPLRILRNIYLPVSIPAITALSAILFVTNWNEYYWPLLVLTDEMKQVLPVAITSFTNEGIVDWGPTMAVATLTVLPVMVLYFFLQKNFVESFSQSGLK
ncbi:carbohydrate ABC transporter permease [Alteribacillus iranensis]|uniref:Carbohydrate ABC transporter membrane protein 2, CUT1 family n=1 Tax=Alteribacillus iranensis TaxID=930128 RepID=A0A1I2BLI4_9BACI|nr:carbohydrate ABC transporter permease [Alteribacillus iranensis]SFE56123.1 carbohydrate ABC transporter membrane protein 2, CUT1 family [Alteribacillus iranensis]